MIARLAALLLTIATAHAGPLEIDKSPRMAAIETKFHMHIVGILRHEKTDMWVFVMIEPTSMMKGFPVTVPKNATDHDVSVALTSARNCAAYYDVHSEEQPKPTPRATPSPADSTFTMPTHPPGEQSYAG